MLLYPAIDLKGGECVRLFKGEMAQATVYNKDPGAQARAFADAGCAWIHVVDLDGAFAGEARNAEAVRAIIAAAPGVKIQLGGGIRDRARIDAWLGTGVARVILGTAAAENPALVRAAAKAHPGRVAAGIDARNGMVAVEGWARTTSLSARDLASAMADAGVAAIIHTDIERDGALQGPNVEATAALGAAVPVPVIASGGVSSLEDLKRLRAARTIAGAIMGRALYDGRVDLRAALSAMEAVPC